MAPLEELKELESLIGNAADLEALKPIYHRLDQIGSHHGEDFEVQLVVAELRENLVHRGVALRRLGTNGALVGPVPPPKKPMNIRRTLAIGAGIGVVGWLVLFVTLVQIARNRNMTPAESNGITSAAPPAAGTVAVDIITTPPGATIQINNDTKCTSNCRVNLPPGNYQVTAMLDGYDPAATGVTVIPGSTINVTLSLLNQAQTVRIFTDLPSGRVLMDGNPAPDLQDGQLVMDRVKNGKHALQVIGPNGDASFTFDLVAGKAPTITGPVAANNLLAVFVSSFSNGARVVTNSAPIKLSLNGQPQGEVGPQGLDLKNVPAGDQQLTVGEGQDEKKMVVTFGSMPTLTAFLKSDINSGTLVISTGEDEVTVFLNGKEYRRKTRRGQIRIPLLGPVKVKVAKEGFQPEAEQSADVKKGEEARLAFKLRPLPQVASLQVHGAAPGTQVVLDDQIVGRAAADGSLSVANLNPGDRVIELRREGFVTKRLTRRLRAGETLVLNPGDVTLAAAAGTIHLVLTPSEAQVTYRRPEETQSHAARDASLKLEPGVYLFTARASGYLERTERVPVVAGETRNVELALAKEKVEPPRPKPAVVAGTTDFGGWANREGVYIRKGGNRVVVRTGALNGSITFNARLLKSGRLFRAGKLRFFIDDGEKVTQFEIDKKHFSKDSSGDDDPEGRTVAVRIDIQTDGIMPKFRSGDQWVTLGAQPGKTITDGKFGFVIPGSDEIAISNFHFSPK